MLDRDTVLLLVLLSHTVITLGWEWWLRYWLQCHSPMTGRAVTLIEGLLQCKLISHQTYHTIDIQYDMKISSPCWCCTEQGVVITCFSTLRSKLPWWSSMIMIIIYFLAVRQVNTLFFFFFSSCCLVIIHYLEQVAVHLQKSLWKPCYRKWDRRDHAEKGAGNIKGWMGK